MFAQPAPLPHCALLCFWDLNEHRAGKKRREGEGGSSDHKGVRRGPDFLDQLLALALASCSCFLLRHALRSAISMAVRAIEVAQETLTLAESEGISRA